MTNARNSSRWRGIGSEGWWSRETTKTTVKMLNEMKWNYGTHGTFSALTIPLSLSPFLSLLRYLTLFMWQGCKCWNFKPLNVAIVFDRTLHGGWWVEGMEVKTCFPYLPTLHYTPWFPFLCFLCFATPPLNHCPFANWAVSKRF